MTGADAGFTVTLWSDDGVALLEAAGDDQRAVLDAGLRAALTLAQGEAMAGPAARDVRVAPIQGEGRDLPELFADLLEALWEELEFHGPSVQNVRLDGVLRRNGEGFVGWGYIEGALEHCPGRRTLRLVTPPAISDEVPGRTTLRASFRRA